MVDKLKLVLDAIVATVRESGPNGAPGGILYAALMTHGCTLEQFERIMGALVSAGQLEKRGECYYATNNWRNVESATMPQTTKEINIGRRYTCKIHGMDAVVRVDAIDKSGYAEHSTVRIICTDELTNRRVIFRSPARLIAELGERFPEFKAPSGS